MARNAAASSHARSARPTIPPSAATVTGIVCEATRFGSLPGIPSRRAYSCEKPPAPTPASGWSSVIRIPWPTRFARPEVIRLAPERDLPTSSCRTCGTASSTTAVTPASATRASVALRPHATATARTMPARQCDEARLRERDQETEPGRGDHAVEAGDAPAAHAAEEDPGQRGEDRHGQVAAVDGRVPEHRVDAEERRVRVEHLDARVPEHVPRQPLVAADGGVRERGRDEAAPEPREPAAAPRQPGESDREQPERQQERTEQDRAAAHVERSTASRGPSTRRTRPRARPRGRARGRARHHEGSSTRATARALRRLRRAGGAD